MMKIERTILKVIATVSKSETRFIPGTQIPVPPGSPGIYHQPKRNLEKIARGDRR
ncbi:MAG: hypothetical protein K6A80_10195 [Saccharofermentans sp.]|nr:hypothetical protein [Saccharofermentans sp.]